MGLAQGALSQVGRYGSVGFQVQAAWFLQIGGHGFPRHACALGDFAQGQHHAGLCSAGS
jgi:hypothetical protein